MLNLAKAVASVLLIGGSQATTTVGDPAPPTVRAYMTEDSRSFGYDTFTADAELLFRVTFTAVSGETHGRSSTERVWEAQRVRYLPEADRGLERTTSLECPGLLHVLERLAVLEVGKFDVPGITQAPLTIVPTTKDGNGYRFHGWGTDADNARTRLSIEGSAGLVRDLGQAANFQLSSCWRPDLDG